LLRVNRRFCAVELPGRGRYGKTLEPKLVAGLSRNNFIVTRQNFEFDTAILNNFLAILPAVSLIGSGKGDKTDKKSCYFISYGVSRFGLYLAVGHAQRTRKIPSLLKCPVFLVDPNFYFPRSTHGLLAQFTTASHFCDFFESTLCNK